MTTARILNRAQAEAVYSAMCALNNVSFRACDLSFDKAIVKQAFSGAINVIGVVGDDECYDSQSAFATAYGLNSDEWQSDVAAAAGGLTQTAIER